jgi:uncharacterized protein YqgV (UPF0045/DUF77 family)
MVSSDMTRWYAGAVPLPPGDERRLVGGPADRECVRWAAVHRVEFTIEPFVEGQPGPHVTAAIDAVSALGHDVEVGPFGSGCVVESSMTADVVAAVVRAAVANGADHVNIDVQQVDEPGSAT